MTMPHENELGLFDKDRELHLSERCLPHWFQPGTLTFLTFRTADSMPREVVERNREQMQKWLLENDLPTSTVDDPKLLAKQPDELQRAFRRMRDRLWQGTLDGCHGACLLRQSALAKIVGEALLYFDGNRYHLETFVVMPNHVHVLLQFGPEPSLAKQTDSWLRYTAREINRVTGRQGKFWQSEPFDHLVRSLEQYEYLRKYIRENPKQANLRAGDYLFWVRESGYCEV